MIACVGNQHKRMRIDGLDGFAQRDGLGTVQSDKNHFFVISGKTADSVPFGCTAVKIGVDVFNDRFAFGGNNDKILGKIDTFNDRIDHESLGKQTDKRKQTGLDIKDEKDRTDNQYVRGEKSLSDVDVEFALQNQRYNVRASGRAFQVEDDSRAECRKQNGKAQIE